MDFDLTRGQPRTRMPNYAPARRAIRNNIGKPAMRSPSSQDRAQWQS
jgi:hypothetical protein